MNSKIFSFFLVFLLLLSVFCAGAAAALDDSGAIDKQIDIYERLDPIFYHSFLVYISGTMVTIELNHGVSPDSPGYYTFRHYVVVGPNGSSERISYAQPSNIVQFEVTGPGDYSVRFCGNFSERGELLHRNHNIMFTVVDLNDIDLNDVDPDVDKEPKLAIFPSKSYFAYRCNQPDSVFHVSDFAHLFVETANPKLYHPKLYPDLLKELFENNAIYRFHGNSLRSISWYDADSNVVSMTGAKQISLNNNSLNNNNTIDISAFRPELTVNVSRVPDFRLNHIFVCSDLDYTVHTIDGSMRVVHEPKPCLCSFEWQVFVNGIFMENSADFFIGYDDKCLLPQRNLFPNYIMFSNLHLLNDELSLSETISLSIFPAVIKDGGIIKPDLTWVNASVSLTITRELFRISVSNLQDRGSGRLYLVLNDDLVAPIVPTLANIAFPETIAQILINSDSDLIVGTLTQHVLADVKTDLIDDETLIHSVFSIDFSDVAVKTTLNKELRTQNEQIALEFTVPAVDSLGNPIRANDLVVFHVSEVNDVREMKQLRTMAVPKVIEGPFFVVTAYTDSFSLFVIASVEADEIPSVTGSARSFGEAVIASETSAEPPEIEVLEPYGYEPSIPSIADIILRVQGYMSVFSILVVLTAGLFMWDYIRRRV